MALFLEDNYMKTTEKTDIISKEIFLQKYREHTGQKNVMWTTILNDVRRIGLEYDRNPATKYGRGVIRCLKERKDVIVKTNDTTKPIFVDTPLDDVEVDSLSDEDYTCVKKPAKPKEVKLTFDRMNWDQLIEACEQMTWDELKEVSEKTQTEMKNRIKETLDYLTENSNKIIIIKNAEETEISSDIECSYDIEQENFKLNIDERSEDISVEGNNSYNSEEDESKINSYAEMKKLF
jgi:hypothetical protein